LSILFSYTVAGRWLNIPFGRWCKGSERVKVKFWKKNLPQWVFENRVLRRVFGSKRDEVTSVWRKLHNEELNDL
jgi:hypothetical protein